MASKLTLDGGIALVTGVSKLRSSLISSEVLLTVSQKAAGGIGKETALAFAEAGAKGVVFADIDDTGAKAVAEESKKSAKQVEYRALAVKVDMDDAESVQNLITTAVNEFGRIDYAVNSAGVSIAL
jgi:NAD(P)-dependent dehydrogenase (short-subunit alcohol dehydrogenase family)